MSRDMVGFAALEVLATGPQVLLEDRGRPGYGHLGITTSGALDRAALALGNRLVGNHPDAAGLEVLLGGLTVRATADVLIAVTGAPAPLRIGNRPVALYEPVRLTAGAELTLGQPVRGLRSYLSVAGGIDAEPMLGSRSSDPTTGLGPAPVTRGDRLPVGPAPAVEPAAAGGVAGSGIDFDEDAAVELRVVLGPRDDWFTEESRRAFLGAEWTVTSDQDRVGVRLEGAGLDREIGGELPSEGIVRGAIQVPAAGQPLVFLADHPTTGGYPVIAVIVDADVDRLAQARPGQRLKFRAVSART